ncbi:MAG: nucleotidyl transferase AbiEii/AbiGii toxin family protein [Candidatus Heimdallarchaeota archaeon]|nr:nucleotidyl transferase AbiEii/AbiGii toxin family protein [Candidatus Heimdallarchaeota archaeon]
MISEERLEQHMKLKGFNQFQAEIDYLQEIVLYQIMTTHGDDFIFKGGTALAKCYKMPRFSIDLDFVIHRPKKKVELNIDTVLKGLNEAGYPSEENWKRRERRIVIEGITYDGNPITLRTIRLDISDKEKISKTPQLHRLGEHIEEISNFDCYVLHEEEIMAEKFRTMYDRTKPKARDLYDLWYLRTQGIFTFLSLINKKMEVTEFKFDPESFEAELNDRERIWDSEIGSLVKKYPTFETAKEVVMDFVYSLDL